MVSDVARCSPAPHLNGVGVDDSTKVDALRMAPWLPVQHADLLEERTFATLSSPCIFVPNK